MLDKITLTGRVKDGLPVLDFPEALHTFEGREINVQVLKQRRPARSHGQNNYFHGVVLRYIHAACIDLGMTSTVNGVDARLSIEDVKEMLKTLFCPRGVVEFPGGGYSEFIRNTSTLDTSEFGEFIAACIRFAAVELDLIIPDPPEEWR